MDKEAFIAAMLLLGYDAPLSGCLFPATPTLPWRMNLWPNPTRVVCNRAENGRLYAHHREFRSYDEALAFVLEEACG